MRRRGFLYVALVALGAAACQREAAETREPVARAAPATPSAPAAGRPRVVALGDSLTAGLGLSPEQSWPSLVQQKIDQAGLDVEVVNAGVSGDTSAGGLRRLDWALDGDVKVLVLELGANDGLRGLPADAAARQPLADDRRGQGRAASPCCCAAWRPRPTSGRSTPASSARSSPTSRPNTTSRSSRSCSQGVAGDAALNQSDGIHPNEEGTRRVADLIWQSLQPLLTRAIATS